MKKSLYIAVGALAGLLVVAMIASAMIWPVIDAVETGVTAQYPEIQPRYYSTAPERIFEEARESVEALPNWELVVVDRRQERIEAERTAGVVRIVSDVSIRVEPVTEFVSQVHVRSASRVGKGDLGQNARNIEEFFAELDGRLGAVLFRPGGEESAEVSEEGEEERQVGDLE